MNRKRRDEILDDLKYLHADVYMDFEDGHQRADNILCEVLIELGYSDIVNAWEGVGKWYS